MDRKVNYCHKCKLDFKKMALEAHHLAQDGYILQCVWNTIQ